MQKKLRTLVALLLLSVMATAQITFQRTYGGLTADEGFFATPTSDGGFILAGNTASYGAGQEDAWLLKTDASGNVLWTKAYGGSAHESISYVTQLADHSYVFCGETFSYGVGNGDAFLAKSDSTGNLLWFKTYGKSSYDIAYSLQPTPDGGFIVCGLVEESTAFDYDAFLVKTDANGDTAWTRIIGGPGVDHAVSVINTSDGGYMFSGKVLSYGAGYCDYYLVKTNALGDTLWTNIVGGAGWDEGMSVKEVPGGGYIVCGGGNSFGSLDYDYQLLRLDASGAVQWMKTYGGQKVESSYCLALMHDGGYAFTGYTETYGPGHSQRNAYNIPPQTLGTDSANMLVVRTDASGDTLWSMTYGGAKKEESFFITELADHGLLVAGYSSSFGPDSDKVFLVRTDSMGFTGCSERRAHPNMTSVTPTETHVASPMRRGMTVSSVTPATASPTPTQNFVCLTTGETPQPETEVFQLFPNPADDEFFISGMTAGEHRISISDISGRIMRKLVVQNGQPVSLRGLDAGIYFVCVDEGVMQKVVKR